MSNQGGKTDGAQPAVLLVHGFNGEPIDMLELEQHLQTQGYATRNLLLPGHGTSARNLAHTRWNDWSAAVAAATDELLTRTSNVVLVGHSMGAALSLHTAANDARVTGVAALCPPMRMHPGEVEFVAVTRLITPYLPTFREDVRDRGAHLRYTRNAYRWTPLPAVHSLYSALPALRAELPRMCCPALVICARRDHVVPVRDGIEAFQLLGTADKELLVLEQSYHVVTKDVERAIVFDRVGAFVSRVVEPAHVEQRRGA